MKNKNSLKILSGFILFFSGFTVLGQTVIKTGEIRGLWTKALSPYIITGDINIPEGKSLTIQPGVKIQFKGQYYINVQGSLNAVGTTKDSIIFTVSDTTGVKKMDRYGWNGIRFDKRPVKWNITKFIVPEDEEFRKFVQKQIDNKLMDTTTRINLVLQVPDEVNDTTLPDSIFINKIGSKLSYCKFEYGTALGKEQPYVFGGAVYIYRYSNLVINNCVFENNFAYAGGAIYCKEAAPVIFNNSFTNCWSQSSGGAMVFINSGPIIQNNVFIGNVSGFNGGAILFYESTPFVTANTFRKNSATFSGGGIYCEKNIDYFIANGNYTPAENLKFGRDFSFEKTNLSSISLKNITSSYGRFLNNVICDNIARSGGGIGLAANAPEFINNTISNNSSESEGGGILCYYSSPYLTNSIVFGNKGSQVSLFGNSSPEIKYCDIESGLSGIKKDSTCKSSFQYYNNINNNPLYVNKSSGDYSLSKGSPCIDAGIKDTSTLKLTAVDLSGKNRIVNKSIDIGAIEYISSNPVIKSTEKIENLGNAENENNHKNELFTSVFPNPTNGLFSVVIHDNPYSQIEIKVFSLNGSEIFKKEYTSGNWFESQINLNGKAHGSYILMIYSGENILYKGEIIVE